MGLRGHVEIAADNFAGGQASAKNKTSLQLHEALALDNLVIKPGGNGFRNRYGNSVFNSTAMASGAAVTGLAHYYDSSNNEFLCANPVTAARKKK